MYLVTPETTISPLAPELLGASIDLPRSGTRSNARSLPVAGWVVARYGPVSAIVARFGSSVRHIPLTEERPDVDAYLNRAGGGLRSGFLTTIDLRGNNGNELSLGALLVDGNVVQIGTIHLRRSWLSGVHPREQDVVSVIIPSFNGSNYVGEAIESCLRQTYSRLEIVVVDDGSTDNTQQVVSRYQDVRLVSRAHGGPSAARNTGIRRSNGQYLMFLDAQDRLRPDAVQLNVDMLKAFPECAFVSGTTGCPAPVTFNRGVFTLVGGFDVRPNAGEPYNLYRRIARQFPVRHHPIPGARR